VEKAGAANEPLLGGSADDAGATVEELLGGGDGIVVEAAGIVILPG